MSARVIRYRWNGDAFLPSLRMAMLLNRHTALERLVTVQSHFCCRACFARIALVSAAIMSRNRSGTFRRDAAINHVGIEFRVLKFLSTLENAVETYDGYPPELDNSWYEGYAWENIRCSSCRCAIGWLNNRTNAAPGGMYRVSSRPSYPAPRHDPEQFWGLADSKVAVVNG